MTISIEKAKNILESQKWERPSDYGGHSPDGDYLICGRNRDSDCLANSNYTRIFQDLEKLNPDDWDGSDHDEFPPCYDFRAGHWAAGWVEYVIVKKNAPDSMIIAAAKIVAELSDYPVYDEDHYFELEHDKANSVWRDCYDWRERVAYMKKWSDQFDFTDYRDMIACARGEYFAGHAGELLY